MFIISGLLFLAVFAIEPGDHNKRVDFTSETGMTLASTPAGSDLAPTDLWRPDIFDFVDKKAGDFSLRYTVKDSAQDGVVGLTPGPFIESWPLSPGHALCLWIKVDHAENAQAWGLTLVDSANRRISAPLADFAANGQWQQYQIDLASFAGDNDFAFDAARAIQFDRPLPTGCCIRLDDVYFQGPAGDVLGVTDKTYEQRIAEAHATRPARVEAGMRISALGEGDGLFNNQFARLWLNQDVDAVNRELLSILTSTEPEVQKKYGTNNYWNLRLNAMLCRLYFHFGNKGRTAPGKLYPETEKALLELLWKRMLHKNDIHLAKQSTWWLTGSENHDINAKVSALLSSQIFMHEPDFADRVYPDAGTGGGDGYWFYQMYGDVGDQYAGPPGRAEKQITEPMRAADHYRAWVDYWNEYITQRVQKGFFVEVAASGYMGYTIPYLMDMYAYSEDPQLKQRAKLFMDLIWAEWAQDQISGVRGGAKTRWKRHGTSESTWGASRFLLGGPCDLTNKLAAFGYCDYELPPIVWHIALDREGKGSFEYISRKPGEDPLRWPRPLGLERTLMCDTDSRFVRYSWVTPDYILGTQMDHPAAVHSHLSASGRWQGVMFSSAPNSFISPCAIIPEQNHREQHSYYRSVQCRNVLITQQARRWFQQNPDWFPAVDMCARPFAVQFAAPFDRLEERNGWIFVLQGNACVAVRVVNGDPEPAADGTPNTTANTMETRLSTDVAEWTEEKRFLMLKDKFSAIIMDTGRLSDYDSFEAFQDDVLDNPIHLINTVVPGWYILRYRGTGPDAPELYFNMANCEIPQIGGTLINYEPNFTFQSPFIHSDYNGTVVTLTADGDTAVLDFTPRQP